MEKNVVRYATRGQESDEMEGIRSSKDNRATRSKECNADNY